MHKFLFRTSILLIIFILVFSTIPINAVSTTEISEEPFGYVSDTPVTGNVSNPVNDSGTGNAQSVVVEKPAEPEEPPVIIDMSQSIIVDGAIREGTTKGTMEPLDIKEECTLRYYIYVTNNSEESIKNLKITTRVPDGLKYITGSSNISPTIRSGKIKWTLNELKADNDIKIYFDLKSDAVLEEKHFDNYAEISYKNSLGDTNTLKSNELEFSVYPKYQVDVDVTQVKLPEEEDPTKETLLVKKGDTIRYYITVKNTGIPTIKSLQIINKVPKDVEVLNISGNGEENNSVIIWDISDISPNSEAKEYFDIKIPEDTKENGWECLASIKYQDSTQGLYGATAKTSSTVELRLVPDDLIYFTQSLKTIKDNVVVNETSTTYKAGIYDTVRFNVVLTSASDTTLHDIEITSPIPNNMKFIAASDDGVVDDGYVTWKVDELEPSQTLTRYFDITVPPATNTYSWKNSSRLSYIKNNNEEKTVLQSNVLELKAEQVMVLLQSEHSVVDEGVATKRVSNALSIESNDTVRFYHIINNNSDSDIHNVVIEGPIPDGFTVSNIYNDGVDNGTSVLWSIDTVEANSRDVVYFDAVAPIVSERTKFRTLAGVSYDEMPNKERAVPSNPLEQEIQDPTLRVLITQSNGVKIKTSSDIIQDVKPGDEIHYKLLASNTSMQEAINITVTDNIPSGLQIVPASISDNGEYSGNSVIWKIEKLGPLESKELTFDVIVPKVEEDTEWINIAHITNEQTHDESSNEVKITNYIETEEEIVEVDNTPEELTTDDRALAGISTSSSPMTEETLPQVTLRLVQNVRGAVTVASGDPITARSNEVISYTLSVINNEAHALYNIEVEDKVPEGMIIMNQQDATIEDGILRWKIDKLPAKEKMNITFDLKIPAVSEDTKWKNTATITKVGNKILNKDSSTVIVSAKQMAGLNQEQGKQVSPVIDYGLYILAFANVLLIFIFMLWYKEKNMETIKRY